MSLWTRIRFKVKMIIASIIALIVVGYALAKVGGGCIMSHLGGR